MKTIQGKDKILLGTNKESKERIYLDKPSFDCSWYWGFGYLGNKDCHYHLEGYQKTDRLLYTKEQEIVVLTQSRNISIYDALLADYNLNPTIEKNLWVFCELALSIYTLKDCAELFNRGGSHMTTNPDQELLKSKTMYDKLTFELIPAQCQTLWDLVGGNNG